MALFEAHALSRREDQRFLVGEGCYAADGGSPGMLWAAFVRSPHAHAKLGVIDCTAARSVAGCVGVFTHDDLEGIGAIPGGIGFTRPDGTPAPKTDRPLLAGERVRYVGEAVALVVGTTHWAALDAAERVAVEYEALPLVTDPDEALGPEAPAVWDKVPDNIGFVWRGGDPERTRRALEGSARVVRRTFPVSRVLANSLEPRGAWAELDPSGRLVLHASIQTPYGLRNGLAARTFRVDPSAIRVIAGDVGGSFGMKAGIQPEYALVSWAAKSLGRPVRWIANRTEGFLSDEHAREIHITAELGLDEEARFTALRVRWVANLGAYVTGRSGWCVGNMGGIAGVYAIPAIAAESWGVLTNTVPTGAYRGAGRPEATYTIERIVNAAAAELEIDPYELRRRNLIPPEAMPYKTALTFNYDCGEFEENMRVAGRMADLAGFPERRAKAARRGHLRGIGICNSIEVAGGPFLHPLRDMARVALAEDGTLRVQAGVMSTGQGLETAFCQLVADRFGVPLARVFYEQGDTDQLPDGKGSGGSASLCTGGAALWLATDRLIERAKRIAAEKMEVATGDVALQGGRFTIVGTDRSIDLAGVARAARERGAGGDSEARRTNEKEAPDGGLAELGEFLPEAVSYPNGTHICEVEIDPETGVTEIVSYSAVEDLGAVVNPLLVDGQLHGGITQGIGQAMGEHAIHDRESGQLLTASFMDYPMPHADDVPNFHLASRHVLTNSNPIGVKGVGEAGTVGALAAVMNAVNDALSELGISDFDMPATPARVWQAIQSARARKR